MITDESGGPNVGQCFLYVAGAGVAFALVNTAITSPLAPLAMSIGFMLLAGLEMGFAGHHHEAGGSLD